MTHSVNYLLNGASQNNQCQASAGEARCSAGIILGDTIYDAMPLYLLNGASQNNQCQASAGEARCSAMWLRGARQNARFEALMGYVFAN